MKNDPELEEDDFVILANINTFRKFPNDIRDRSKNIVRDIEKDCNALNLFIHEPNPQR